MRKKTSIPIFGAELPPCVPLLPKVLLERPRDTQCCVGTEGGSCSHWSSAADWEIHFLTTGHCPEGTKWFSFSILQVALMLKLTAICINNSLLKSISAPSYNKRRNNFPPLLQELRRILVPGEAPQQHMDVHSFYLVCHRIRITNVFWHSVKPLQFLSLQWLP